MVIFGLCRVFAAAKQKAALEVKNCVDAACAKTAPNDAASKTGVKESIGSQGKQGIRCKT